MRRKLLTVATAAMMAGALVVSPLTSVGVKAETADREFQYAKYLVMKNNATVPNVTFEYEIKRGDAVETLGIEAPPAGLALPVIKASGDTVDTSDAQKQVLKFTDADTTIEESAKGNAPVQFATAATDDEKYVNKNMTVDFSNVNFTAPGIYRYVLTEKVDDKAHGYGINYDVTKPDYEKDDTNGTGIRYLDVYVSYDTEKDAAGNDVNKNTFNYKYILHTDSTKRGEQGKPETITDKSAGFINSYDSYDLQIKKEVAGNQASKDEYFKFTVNINNDKARGNGKLQVEVANHATTGEITYQNAKVENPTEISLTNGTGTADFYLKHGEYVVIKGITWHTQYSVKEDKTVVDQKGYTVSSAYDLNGDKESSGAEIKLAEDYSMTDIWFAADSVLTFTNTRQGNVPTGVAMTVLPGVAVIAIGAAGIVLFARKKREEY